MPFKDICISVKEEREPVLNPWQAGPEERGGAQLGVLQGWRKHAAMGAHPGKVGGEP